MLQIGKKVFWLAAMALAFASCGSKDNKLGHDVPYQMVCRFVEGTLVEPAAGSINVLPSAFTPKPNAKPMFCHLTASYGGTFSPLPNYDSLKFKKDVWYKMENVLFDSKNNSITDQFLKPKQIDIHQFFFNLISSESVVTNGVSYFYADTVDGQFIESPVGFTGFIRFNKDVDEMQLRVLLVHVENGTKYEADGKPNPFDKPSPRVLEFGDLSAFLPFTIE